MVFRFVDCRLDDAARQLTRSGHEQRLTKKAYALLMLLLGARPRVVTKQEIMDALWPDTFVSEASIAALIGEVREAVGDSARDSTVIHTHSGVGYSVVADVVESVRGDATPSGLVAVLQIGARRLVLSHGVKTIGRDESCDVQVEHPSVSRLHARITIDGATARIEDAASRNGLLVNGRRVVDRMNLPSGATVKLGSVDASFVFEEGGAGSTLSLLLSGA